MLQTRHTGVRNIFCTGQYRIPKEIFIKTIRVRFMFHSLSYYVNLFLIYFLLI